MKDSIIAGTGNSRYLRTSIPADTTWADALAMLRAGTFPIDLAGINAAGFTQVGTALNTANLLKSAVVTALGLDADATPSDAWEEIITRLNGKVTSVAGKTGEVSLTAGDVAYSASSDYSTDTVGSLIKALSDAYSASVLANRDVRINAIAEKITKTVDPTSSSVKTLKAYNQISATQNDSFYVSLKISSQHPTAFAYNVRARKSNEGGATGTYYYLLPTPQTVASEAVVEGVLSGFGADTVGLTFQLVYYYVGSGASSYSEVFSIEHFTVLDADVEYYGDKTKYLINTFSHTDSDLWERGYYSETTGKPSGSADSSAIRTKSSLFIQACKGSTIINLASNAYLRYCVYTKPYESYFVGRYQVSAGGNATITDDCYIRVYMTYTDSTAFDLDTWIANLPPLWSGEIIQFNPMIVYSPADPALSDSSENGIQNKVVTQTFNIMMPSFVLPANWESKVQTIQEAQGTKFTFAIQTDTHYALDGDIYSGANLKALTNRIGFDFVANLGDVIKGYAGDENAPENMRAAMTEIMMRYVRGISCPLFIAMGNHDTNKQWADANSGTPFTFDEVWGREFRPSFNTIPGAVFQTGLMYYFKDFNDVRVIVLNTQDGADGGFGIGSTQISWLTNTALNTNKPVLVMSHVPIVNGWSVGSNYVSSYANAVAAIKAFQTGGGTVIGCMSGHTHTQESKTVDGLLYVTFRNSGTLCEVVMVDLANKTINTIPVGFTGAGNRSFTYT